MENSFDDSCIASMVEVLFSDEESSQDSGSESESQTKMEACPVRTATSSGCGTPKKKARSPFYSNFLRRLNGSHQNYGAVAIRRLGVFEDFTNGNYDAVDWRCN